MNSLRSFAIRTIFQGFIEFLVFRIDVVSTFQLFVQCGALAFLLPNAVVFFVCDLRQRHHACRIDYNTTSARLSVARKSQRRSGCQINYTSPRNFPTF